MYELNDRTLEKQPYPLKKPTKSKENHPSPKNHPDPEEPTKINLG
jgi:hypothetical protein